MPSTPEVIGKYKIERFLASGGMGDIYLARDPMLDRLVAIKLLREGFDSDELRERFEREARAAGRLSHPNIVTIYEFGLFQERPFIAMEYVPGESLATLIRRREPLSLTRKLELMEGLCAGLAHAHRASIVHRDIKPANLIVDPEGSVKVLDFGIVKLAGSGLTHHGVLVGTVNYMSPEQIAGAPDGVDHRSDVFAVGAVFYELLAYQRAFPGQMAEVLYKIVHTAPDPISRLCPGLDPAIERAVNKCLDRSAERRYQDLTALRRDVARIRQRLDLETTPDTSTSSGDTLVIHTPSQGGSAGVQPLTPDRVSGLLVSAQAALEARDVDRAIAIGEQAAAAAPTDPRVRQLLRAAQSARETQRVEALLTEAAGHLEAQRLVEARVAIDLAMAAQPDSPRALEMRQRIDRVLAEEERRRDWTRKLGSAMNRARAELDRGALADASHAIEEALSLDPENAGALTLRRRIDAALAAEQERVRLEQEARAAQRDERLSAAEAALEADELTKASRAVDEAAALGGGAAAASLRERIDTRRRALDRATACVRDADMRLRRGELEAALALLDEALTLAPEHAEAVALRVRVATAIEEQAAREAWLRSAVDRAREALRHGEHAAALETLEQARQVDASWPDLAGLIDEATRQQDAALERQRRAEQMALDLAQAADALARQDLGAAQARVDAVFALDPSSAPARELAAQIAAALEARRAEEARRRAEEERARRLAQIARGRDALAAGRVEEAVSVLKPLARSAQDEPGFVELLQSAETELARLEAERRRARERAQRIAAALERSAQALAAGSFAAANAAVDEALVVDAAHGDALAMRQRVGAAIEARVDELIAASAGQVAKERHQRAIDTLERAGFAHPRLDAELARVRQAAEALALERRVDDALSAARGRFRRRSPEDILAALEQSGLQHPRIEQEMQIARAAIAEAERRATESAQAQQAREQQARDDKARADQAREEKARAEKARADQARADKARADQAREEKARADQVRADRTAADKAAAAKAAAERAAAERASADQARKARLQKPAAQKPGVPVAQGALPSPAPPPQWQRPALLVGAAILVLTLGYVAARQIWPSPQPDPGTRLTQVTPGTSSTPPAGDPQAPPQTTPSTTPPGSIATDPATAQPGQTPTAQTPTAQTPPAAVEPSAPATPAPDPAASLREQAEQAAARIRGLIARGDRDGALGQASAIASTLYAEPAVRDMVRRLVNAAQGDAEQSRANARRVGAQERDAAGYAAAQGTYQAADRALKSSRFVEAARGYWRADDLFAEAAARALTPVTPAAPPTSTQPDPQVTTPREAPRETPREPEVAPPTRQAPTQPQTQTPAVVQQQTPPPAREPERAPTPAFDAGGVQAALAAYAAAYASLDVGEVVRVYPKLSSSQRDSLASSFGNTTRYELTLGSCEIAQQGGPTQARATCSGGRRSIRFKRGAPLDRSISSTFTLERRGSGWLITSAEVR